MEFLTVGIAGFLGTLAIGALVWIVRAWRLRSQARSGSAPLVIDDVRREQLKRAAVTEYSERFTHHRNNGSRRS